MKPAKRMVAMEKLREGDRPPRSEYGGGTERRMIGYDRRDEPDMRRGRDGRFAAYGMGGEYRPDMPRGNSYGDIYAEGMIYAPGAMNRPMGGGRYRAAGREAVRNDGSMYDPSYRSPGTMDSRGRGRHQEHIRKENGTDDGEDHERGSMHEGNEHWPEQTKITEHDAREWTENMENVDNSTGPHFDLQKAERLRMTNCPQCEKWPFYVAVNMMYSDYCRVARDFEVDEDEFYACMAKAYLEDPDGDEGRLRRNFEKH